jgi:geranylgeranyl diphosphate synthase type I
MATLQSGVPALISRHRAVIEGALVDAIGPGTSEIEAAARYVMGWQDEHGRPATPGGKRIRPAMVLLAAEIFGGSTTAALPGAVAIELVHNFSLVHDEVQDHDAERHHRPTAYRVWGEGQAINLGDFLYTRALRALTHGTGDPARRLAALDVVTRATEGMIAGQWQDISFEARESVSVEEYLAMVEGKTGVLLGASLEAGALLAGAASHEAETIGRWGVRLGLAFQAVDDYLGIWGDEALTGKTTTGDIGRKKKTLPIVHGLNDPQAGSLLREAFAADRQLEAYGDIVSALERAGADSLCRETARRFASDAEALIASLELDDAARKQLAEVADYFCDRSF